MTFYDEISGLAAVDIRGSLERVTPARVGDILSRSELQSQDFLGLLSPAAAGFLEPMAQAAHRVTLHNFGPNILLFTPLYLGNYCVNHCVYCGFAAGHEIGRRRLTLPEVELEARAIAGTGLQHLLILTGESREHTPVSYIADCVGVLRKYFSSVSIEVYPLSTEEYAQLIAAGVDGLTIYQEVYDRTMYAEVHPKGPKRDYRFRLEAPERAGDAGIRTIAVGPLLGLYDWRSEVFFAGLHAAHLQRRFPEIEIGISLPRMRPEFGGYEPNVVVSDRDFVQALLALRLFLPRVGITMSTRERPDLRDNLMKLGVTKMSAGSSTAVGGHTGPADSVGQFEISDERSVAEMRERIACLGYKPVLKDWHDMGRAGEQRPSVIASPDSSGRGNL